MALHDEYDIQVAAGTVSRRHALNLVAGSGISYSLTDDSANDRSDLTITATGGGGGSGAMPWNTIGGWVGSTGDPAATNGSVQSALTIGTIYAAAFVADTATAFTNLGFTKSTTAMTGSGSIFTITDASGNNLATASNSDAELSTSTAGYAQMTLGTTVTPTAGSKYYVVFLFPSTVTAVPTFYGYSANSGAINSGSAVRFRAYTSTGQSTIPSPITINTTSFPTVVGGLPFFGVK
jgi:hypothetical protein